MRENVTDKKIRLGEVASALDVSPKLIRNWTSAEEFDLLDTRNRAENKWREYSYLDVAHLAIAAQLIRYGFSVGEGHDFAGYALERLLGLRSGIRLNNAPAGIVEASSRGKHLYLFKPSKGEPVAFMHPMDALPRYHAAVHVDLEMCIHLAFSGLADMGHDAFADSRPKEYSDEEAAELERASQSSTGEQSHEAAAVSGKAE